MVRQSIELSLSSYWGTRDLKWTFHIESISVQVTPVLSKASQTVYGLPNLAHKKPKMFHDQYRKPIYFGVKRSKVKATSQLAWAFILLRVLASSVWSSV